MDKNNTKEEKNMSYVEKCNHINQDYYPQWATNMAHMSDMHIFDEKDLDAMIPYIKLALKTGPIHLHVCNLIINEETGEISRSCDENDDEEDYTSNIMYQEDDDEIELTPEDYAFINQMERGIFYSSSNNQIADLYKKIAEYCNDHHYSPDVYRKMCEMITED